MKFCFHCGKELNYEAAFCPFCGGALHREEPVQEAQPVKKRVNGGVLGRGIASIALGAGGLFFSVYAWFFFLFEFVFGMTLEASGEYALPGALVFFIYVFIFALIALGCAIAGKILAGKALELSPGYKLAKIGNVLSLIAIITSGVISCLGMLFLFIW